MVGVISLTMNKRLIAICLVLFAGMLGLAIFWPNRKPVPSIASAAAVSQSARRAPPGASPVEGTISAPERRSKVPQKAEDEKEKTARLRAMTNRPEFREMGVRHITKNYRPLFDRLQLSDQKEGLLVTIILDRMTSTDRTEWDDYEKLAVQLLTENEYAEFQRFRDEELPLKNNTIAAVAALKAVGGGAVAEREPIIAALVRAASHNGDPMWLAADRREGAGTLTLAEVNGLAAVASQRLEAALALHSAGLSEAEKQVLRAWFQKTIIDANIDGMRRRLKPGAG